MTKGRDLRSLGVGIATGNTKQADAAKHIKCSVRSLFNWRKQLKATGVVYTKTKRRRVDGRRIAGDHLTALLDICVRDPELYDRERAVKLFAAVGVAYTRRQVCEACKRKGWTHKVLRNFALEQDEILKDQWRWILRPRRLGGVFDSII